MYKIVITASLIILTLLFNSVSISCRRIDENTNQKKIFKVDVENCNTLFNLKLSDLIDSCRLVSLETTNESVLGTYFRYIYISEDYIIVDENNGIYLFAQDGKFINKIVNIGRGPQDVSLSHSLYYYEKKDLLLINDRFNNKDKILCYDVKSQTFQSPIKKCFNNQWADFMVYNDSMILGSLYEMDAVSNPYALFLQDFNGNFISGIKSNKKFTIPRNHEEVLQRTHFYPGDHKILVKYSFDDTLFAMDGEQIIPYLITQYTAIQTDPPHSVPEIGERRSYYEGMGNSSFIIFKNQTFKGLIPINGGEKADYEVVYFLLDKSNGNYGIIRLYTDDFIGKIMSSDDETITFPSSLPDDKLYVVYNPSVLLHKSSLNITDLSFPDSVYNQLNKIKEKLNETDNPVLLIGIAKKKLELKKR